MEQIKKMVKSISFKKREEKLWDHLNKQFDPNYYIKHLIYLDMQHKGIKNDTNIELNTHDDKDDDLLLDFDI